jgi:cytochrome c553
MKIQIVCILGLFVLSSCGQSKKETANAADCDSTLTYDSSIKTIVNTNCIGCHGAGSSNGNYSTLASLQADKAEVYSEVASGSMPQGNSAFKDSADGRSLKAWLSCSTLK